MNYWKESKLIDLCEKITVGHVGSMADEYIETGIPFLRSLNIKPYQIDYNNLMFIDQSFHEKLKKSSLKAGDVAVVRTGYPGTASVIPKSLGESNCSDLVIVRPGKNLNSHFLAAIFNSAFGKSLVSGNLVGAAQQHFNVNVAKELRLLFPPKEHQDKIAAILSAYDDLIENNNRRIALLEKMAEEIYREWFVSFRFPGYQTAEFEKGIPKGWEQVRLDDFCEKVTDGTHDTPKPTETGYYLVTGKNIKNAQIDFNGAYFISENNHKEISKRSGLKQWDILYSNIGTIGQTAIVGANPDFSVKNVIIFRPKDYSHCIFLSYVLKNPAIAEQLMMMSSGASQQFIGLGAARGFKILQPSTKLISQFGEWVLSLFNQVDTLIKINKNLETAKATLLPRLISGKLSVEHLDIQFPPSMLNTEIEGS